MRRLFAPDGTGGPSAYVYPNSAELDVHDDAGRRGEGLQFEAFGSHPQHLGVDSLGQQVSQRVQYGMTFAN
jgi:hypothetical protein